MAFKTGVENISKKGGLARKRWRFRPSKKLRRDLKAYRYTEYDKELKDLIKAI